MLPDFCGTRQSFVRHELVKLESHTWRHKERKICTALTPPVTLVPPLLPPAHPSTTFHSPTTDPRPTLYRTRPTWSVPYVAPCLCRILRCRRIVKSPITWRICALAATRIRLRPQRPMGHGITRAVVALEDWARRLI